MEESTINDAQMWLETLIKRQQNRNSELRKFSSYYEGEHNLAYSSERFRKAFGGIFDGFSDNWCQIIVDAVAERLKVTGFRFGEDTADAEAWRIWNANNLDAQSGLAHTEALINGESYALVWPNPTDPSTPTITVEHPTQMIVAYSPGNRSVRQAAMKRYVGDDGHEVAYIYLHDSVWRFRSKLARTDFRLQTAKAKDYELAAGEGDPDVDVNPMGVVPVIPLITRPRMLGGGHSEIKTAIPIQDAINKLLTDMLVAAEYTAFQQRVMLGYEHELDEFGNAIKPPWDEKSPYLVIPPTAEGNIPNVKEINPGDLSNFIKGVELLVQHLAAQTRTPPHYLLGQSGAFPSGESLKSTETGLVAKTRDRAVHYGEGWAEAARLAFLCVGDLERAEYVSAATLWKDPETRSEAELADSVMKKLAMGVPWEQCMVDLGYTPEEIARMKRMRQEDALLDPFNQLGGAALQAGEAAANGSEPAIP